MANDELIYMDFAAATPVDEDILAAMLPYFSDKFYNPSALYLPAVGVRRDIDAARVGVAFWLGVRPSEIVFTAGGTEANNLAIQGVMMQFPDANVVVSTVEHESVLQSAHTFDCVETPVLANGIVDLEALKTTVDDDTVLVSIMYANNEVGTIQPIRQIAQVLEEIKTKRRASGNNLPLYFHTDAAQAANYLDLHAARLGVDLLTINGGKIYGPKQCGALFVSSHISLNPQILGGGQERGLRSGTENVPGIIGLRAALDKTQQLRHQESRRLQTLQKLFFDLLETKIPTAIINGSLKSRLPNNVHVTFPGSDNERLMLQLESETYLCATGSACSASNQEPSHVLSAMGISEDLARASLRFTFGRSTTEGQIRSVVDVLARLIG